MEVGKGAGVQVWDGPMVPLGAQGLLHAKHVPLRVEGRVWGGGEKLVGGGWGHVVVGDVERLSPTSRPRHPTGQLGVGGQPDRVEVWGR